MQIQTVLHRYTLLSWESASCSSSISPPDWRMDGVLWNLRSRSLLVIPRHALLGMPLETPEDICAKRRLLRPPPQLFEDNESTIHSSQPSSLLLLCVHHLYHSSGHQSNNPQKKWPLLHPRSEPSSSSPSAFRPTQTST